MFGTITIGDEEQGALILRLIPRRAVRRKPVIASAGTIVFLSMSLTFLLAAGGDPASVLADHGYSSHEVSLMVSGHVEQVEMLKWVGGIMVVALASAVGFLIRELLRSHRVLVNEVRVGSSEREKLTAALRNVAQLLHDKPCLHERYLEGLAEERDGGLKQ